MNKSWKKVKVLNYYYSFMVTVPKEMPRKGIGEGATELQYSHQYYGGASTMGQQQPEKGAGLSLEEKLCIL